MSITHCIDRFTKYCYLLSSVDFNATLNFDNDQAQVINGEHNAEKKTVVLLFFSFLVFTYRYLVLSLDSLVLSVGLLRGGDKFCSCKIVNSINIKNDIK